jgi:hypothetical protein
MRVSIRSIDRLLSAEKDRIRKAASVFVTRNLASSTRQWADQARFFATACLAGDRPLLE